MSARLMLALTALLGLTACSFDFGRSSEVLDRRILAIRVEPPELSSGAPRPDFVEASALVVDPREPLAVAEVSWRSCMFPESAGGGFGGGGRERCPEGAGTVLHSSGSSPLSELSQPIPIPEEVSRVLAAGVDIPAPQLRVQLHVGSEQGELIGIKEVTVAAVLPEGQEPNRNPALQRLTLDGADWLPDVPRTLRYGECPDEQKAEVVAEEGSLVTVCEHDLEPLFDEAEAQYYLELGISGKLERERERLRFSWFADAGSFSKQTTEQYDPRDPSPDNVGPRTAWREPPEKPERVTLWVVIRDGRGGIHWERRELIFE
ncbi:MAG: hypothetical protein JXB05_24100 [Myxococcaceae bacterium]|nr:hypothetical protein [Myxococcaceae bacterium]